MNGPANISYLICTTPRSGSTLLCELLEGTGIAGRPDEYFQQLRSTGLPMTPRDYLDGVAADLLPPLDGHDGELEQHALYDPRRFAGFAEYLSWVQARATTDNGVFGTKIMWPYVAGLIDRLSALAPGPPEASPHAVLSQAFPGLRYVWLRRIDKVRQAVSLWRAVQTWQWRKDAERARFDHRPEPVEDLSYSFEAIDHLRRGLEASDRAWEAFFETIGVDPLTLTYEEFVKAKPETVMAVLQHVDVPAPAVPCAPRTARQADELSEHWVHDYASEARLHAVR